MKFDRTKNALRNIIFGLLQRIYQLIVPFAMRTAMIYWLGVEYLGLDGLFISVLSVLNLAELGVGSAMVYSNVFFPNKTYYFIWKSKLLTSSRKMPLIFNSKQDNPSNQKGI